MKQVRMIAGAACMGIALVMAISATAVSIWEPGGLDGQQTDSGTLQPATSTAYADSGETYILRLSGDSVAIYLQGQEESPLLVTDIQANHLRESDRALLENGITVSSYDEILQLLEDLNS